MLSKWERMTYVALVVTLTSASKSTQGHALWRPLNAAASLMRWSEIPITCAYCFLARYRNFGCCLPMSEIKKAPGLSLPDPKNCWSN